MKSFVIDSFADGTRVDRFIASNFDNLPRSVMFKEIRKKNIKVNKKRCTHDQRLKKGDLLELYLNDDLLREKQKYYDFMKASDKLDIIYEDENVLLIDKKPGVLCHPDGRDYTDNIIARVRRYLHEKGEWSPESSPFSPSLANRLDRNTGGIIIAAVNMQSLRVLNENIKTRRIKKYYLTVVHGKMPAESETLKAYLTKNEKTNKVTVTDYPTEKSKEIVTRYTVLDYRDDMSLLEIELITGRTHQIRAHLAYIGHPLVGDGKYGANYGRYRQALYSHKLKFDFDENEPNNILSYLVGREFEIRDIKLVEDFKSGKLL